MPSDGKPPENRPGGAGTVLLCVTGSVAAFRAVELASALTGRSALVLTVMTDWARRFVQPLSFSSVTLAPVFTDADAPDPAGGIDHVSIARRADVLAIVPATAHTIAKAAHGLADNLVTLALLAFRGPVLIAPAMNFRMYESAPVQENLRALRARGYAIVGPAEGRLACGEVGWGRLAPVPELLEAIEGALGERRP
jgi:phosphopantothenoylcysteine decarboxylase/phosphopantothenate--cysteine ligase